MTIGEFSAAVGLPVDTLRYYERIGVLQPVRRGANGYRDFRETDLDWIRFVQRLRATGMPLEGIAAYAGLRDRGPSTQDERKALLVRHRAALEARIREDRAHLEALDAKIRHYESLPSPLALE